MQTAEPPLKLKFVLKTIMFMIVTDNFCHFQVIIQGQSCIVPRQLSVAKIRGGLGILKGV